MSLSSDLLLQAGHLASLDRHTPRQANLRRAISAAYYAMFHFLIAESVHRLSPPSPLTLPSRMARAYVHEEKRQVCRSIRGGNPSPVLVELQPAGFSDDLRLVASVFLQLQEARYQADYDVAANFTRFETLKLIERTESALRAWRHVRLSDESTVFLTALLLAKKWAR